MSGHSKWAQIKHKKAVKDARRGKEWGRLIKEVQVAARGGADPEHNASLRLAVERAKSRNVPNDTIKKAIERVAGDREGAAIETIVYEGYGPGGAAVLVIASTDNKNRTAGEVRHVFATNGGSLGGAGSVSWQFKEKGTVVLPDGAVSPDRLLELAVEAGALDVERVDGESVVTSEPANFMAVLEALQGEGLEPLRFEVGPVPDNLIVLTGKDSDRTLKLLEALDELEDVTGVYTNADFPEVVPE